MVPSVGWPEGTITQTTRRGGSAWTISSRLSTLWQPATAANAARTLGSGSKPITATPPRARRFAMFAPIRPSPTMPMCNVISVALM